MQESWVWHSLGFLVRSKKQSEQKNQSSYFIKKIASEKSPRVPHMDAGVGAGGQPRCVAGLQVARLGWGLLPKASPQAGQTAPHTLSLNREG